jgi:hypothetical protein
MTWIPNSKEIEAVLKLNSQERYIYWIKKVVDQNMIWSLWHIDGWALGEDDFKHFLIPVWPHPSYAILCAKNEWQEYQPKSIPLNTWMDKWIPGIEKDQRLVAVFPIVNNKGIVIKSHELEKDLKSEISLYE